MTLPEAYTEPVLYLNDREWEWLRTALERDFPKLKPKQRVKRIVTSETVGKALLDLDRRNGKFS